MAKRIDTLKMQVHAVEALRLLHQSFSYSKLEGMLGIPRSVLAQYVTGSRVPSPGQAALIVERVLKVVNLAQIITSKLRTMGSIADLEDVVLDPLILNLVSLWAERRYSGRIDVVLSAETIGIPLATAVALSLGARLVIARRRPESTVREYIRAEAGEPPFEVKVFYIPRDKLPPGLRVLLVDDLARTGITLEALARGVKRAGCTVEAAVIIIALGSKWRERLRRAGVSDVHAFLEIP
ncbi:MAG: phosphoribosyltransferase family protein [Thermoproteota archaeon]